MTLRDLGERYNAPAPFEQPAVLRASIELPAAKDSREHPEDFSVIEFGNYRPLDVRTRYR